MCGAMAQFTGVLAILLLCLNYSVCLESEVVDRNSALFSDIIQLISHILKNDSDVFSPQAVSLLNVAGGASPDEGYLIQLDVHAACYRNVSSGCEPLSAICELNVSGSDGDLRALVAEGLRCAEKEPRPVLPAGDKGFIEVDTDAEVRDIAEYAIRQLEEGGAQRRSVLDVMSVKKDSQQSGTRFYLTVKVTATDEGDTSHLEVCELEVNQTSDVTLQSDGMCFPLGDKHDIALSEEYVVAEAEKVVAHLSCTSQSSFLYTYVAVVKAEQSVTPGSEGVLSTYELRMAPSVCLKNRADAGDEEDRRKCAVSSNSSEVICVVTSWERAWLGDTLFSRPDCHLATVDGKTTTNVGAPPAEATTLAEPLAEALVAREQEVTAVPVVEAPVMARQVSCVGCPVELDLQNPALEEFTEQALAHIDSHSKSKYVHSLSRITRAQREVINGIRYIIHMEVLETSCLKGSETNRRLCEPKPESEVQTCVVEFLEKPWLSTSKHIESNNCTQEVSNLENEILPEFVSRDNAEKQEILDYLDALDNPDFEKGFGSENLLSRLESIPADAVERTEPPASERKLYLTNEDLDALSEFGISADEKPELVLRADPSGSAEVQPAGESKKQSGNGAGGQAGSSGESTESEALIFPCGSDQNVKTTLDHSEASLNTASSDESNSVPVNTGMHDTSVEANMDRERRNTQVVGDLRDFKESEKDLVNELAQTAVVTLDELDPDNMKRVVLEILDAKKQIVDGILYHLVMRVGFTHCKEDASSAPDCMQDDISSRICKVQLHQAFAGDKKAKVVQSECGGDAEDRPAVSRTRRTAPGGIESANVSDPDIIRVASTALSHLTQASTGFSKQPCISTIHSASRQVVAGSLYRLTLKLRETQSSGDQAASSPCPPDNDSDAQICYLQVWEKPWMNFFEVTNVSCTPESRTRRAVLVGGRSPVSVDNENVQRLTGLAVSRLAQSSGSGSKALIHVVKAERQVVAGVKWYITFTIGEQNVPSESCNMEVVEQSWLNHTEIVRLECSPSSTEEHSDGSVNAERQPVASRTRRFPSGGIEPASVSDPDIIRIANSALSRLSQASTGFSKQPCIDTIHNASTQIVAGSLYRLKLKLRETEVSVDQTTSSSCPPDNDSDAQICDVEVWEQSWNNFTEVLNASCTPETRTRRALRVGGRSPVSVDSENVQRLTGLAMSHLAQSSGSANKALIHVVKAEKQVVAGVKWFITFTIGEQNVPSESCDLEVVEQAWLNRTEIVRLECTATNVSRTRRSSIGNSIPTPLSTDSEDVKEAAKFALSQLDHTTTSPNAQFLVQIKEAHSQVVDEDHFYFLLLEVGESACPKNSIVDHTSCQRLDNVPTQHCHVDVLAHGKLGSDSKQLINSVCGPADTVSQHVKDTLANSVQRFKRSHSVLVGAPYETQPDDEYIQDLASFALSELDKTSGSEFAMKKVRVVSAKTQIVSGKLVHLTLEVGFSNCRKEDNTISDQCDLQSTSDTQLCHVEVWDQPWNKHREVKTANCGPQYAVHSLKKRSTKNLLGKFEKFMTRFNKKYDSKAEYKRRYHIFKANMKKVELLRETERGTAKYGATKFADLTAKEFKAMFLGLDVKKRPNSVPPLPMASIPDVELPLEFDWRLHNAVTPVKNQGLCGSCWAFSVTGNVEGQWFINKGQLLSLSEQELVDCDSLDSGCEGGEMVTAYKVIEKLGGLETESEYPYDARNDKCHFNRSEVQATITGAVNITKNETEMAQWLVKNGPISIGINANAMQFYFGGVSHPWKILCDPDDLDHGVLIVGFGVHTYPLFHKSLPFWIVKNSWGPKWGEQGYYRVFRGDGTCGVNQMATSAIVV